MDKTTDFGFQKIPEQEKATRVANVFHSVAARYDLMNDLMSAGLHRLWKRFAVRLSGVREGARVLDVAGGTGDVARLFAGRVGSRGEVWLTDINRSMLEIGRDRLLDEGLALPVVQCDGERLPFRSNHFDCVSVAFGLRNMTRKETALAEWLRVLRPGGRLIVLEFSRVWKPLAPLYDLYSFNVLPLMGRIVAHDAASYQYLAESIRVHPSQEELKELMEQVGFQRVEYFNLCAGIVAVHRGYKF
ncbi:MAG: bifunctional demethylmenaquinone methyltransferase/2-methoxy-6-polyprenyl-1,4-benzoquinol methylase UbiE [Azospira oryzae]|nr:MAG: bifunctional demethylmenaquinone methyltransferase/2-methoxy-6-polyprenyl-1,4-benzoquinol methylase UbiE [Azospira oryzae]PZP80310.1 MAG: bifunctional demethylmenaquinone methyltransferase/2-methoxy-6-polyprenyl-1,4-benzoquinol methylase UbiE [Azospira oryzae]